MFSCPASSALLHDSIEPSFSLQPVSHPPVSLVSGSVNDEITSCNEEITGTTVRGCNILLQNDLTEEQKLNVILNLHSIIQLLLTHTQLKMSMVNVVHFSIITYKSIVGWDIHFNLMAVFAFLVVCLLQLKLKCRILISSGIVVQ